MFENDEQYLKGDNVKNKNIIAKIKLKIKNIFKSKGGKSREMNYELLEKHREEMFLKSRLMFPIQY